MQIRILVLAVAACTESSSLTDAGTDGKPGDAGLGPCAARTLCLQPKLVTTGPPPTAPRLVVAWFQPRHVSGLPPMPVEIGYDVAFVPSLARYDIPLDKVRAPTTDSVLLCQWDQGQCQHTAPIPPIGFALPLVLEDGNGNGHIDASEILVMVENGEVTLTGNVPERLMKREAENVAAEASGVRDVHNRIRVDDGSASAGRPGEAIRSGRDQLGSGFSSSDRPDPVYDNMQEDSNWPGRNWPGQ